MKLEAVPALRRALLRWYHAQARDLPWRHTSDPYAILVSELMLQQTQVKTVIPYYEKFLKAFPTARALAKAPEDKVLAAWAGLGYYRRARFLHAAAKAVVARGAFPRDLEGLRGLPGVGAYTAAAVASIAFGLPAAVVDGNVVRVMSRLLALDQDAGRGAGAAAVREAAQALLDPGDPGAFNQAVMELGATLCSPAKPRCPACPLQGHCAAFRAGEPEAYPVLPARAPSRRVLKAVALVVQGRGARAQVLMKPRQASGRLQGFWALPEAALASEDEAMAEQKALREARRLAGKGVALAGRLPKLRHSITVHAIQLWPFWFSVKAAAPRAGWRWVGLAQAGKLPVAAAERKLLATLGKALRKSGDEAGEWGLKL